MVEEVYGELHRIAGGYVRRERAQSVQATDLVHEAYLRLAREAKPRWQNRTHFIAIAAIAMRRLLVERARARGAAKRGGAQVQVTLNDGLLADQGPAELVDLIALDRALTELASLEPATGTYCRASIFRRAVGRGNGGRDGDFSGNGEAALDDCPGLAPARDGRRAPRLT